MDQNESLSHSRWECKYHVVFIPKCRRRTLYKELRKHLEEVFRRLASQKDSRILEEHLMPDHVYLLMSIPPKYAVSKAGLNFTACIPSMMHCEAFVKLGPRFRDFAVFCAKDRCG